MLSHGAGSSQGGVQTAAGTIVSGINMMSVVGGPNLDKQLRNILGVSGEVVSLNYVERSSYKTNNDNESPYNKE